MAQFLDLSTQIVEGLDKFKEELIEEEKKKKESSDPPVKGARWEMDDETLVNLLKPSRAVNMNKNHNSDLFVSKEHEQRYMELLQRKIIPHRTVEFEFLESHGIQVQKLFGDLNWTSFCTEDVPVYPALVAFFYSGLQFDSPDKTFFLADKALRRLDARSIATLTGTPYRDFCYIPGSPQDAYKFLFNDPSFYRKKQAHVQSSLLPVRHQVVHRILTHCLRPKASSHGELAEYEAKVCSAILQGRSLSLSHMILLHMFRSLNKPKGPLPYGALITKLFQTRGHDIPVMFKQEVIISQQVGQQMLSKMQLKATSNGWMNNQGTLLPFGGPDEAECLHILKNTLVQQTPASSQPRRRSRRTASSESSAAGASEETPLRKRKRTSRPVLPEETTPVPMEEAMNEQAEPQTPRFSTATGQTVVLPTPSLQTPTVVLSEPHSTDPKRPTSPEEVQSVESARAEEAPEEVVAPSVEPGIRDEAASVEIDTPSTEVPEQNRASNPEKAETSGQYRREQPASSQGEPNSEMAKLITDIAAFDDTIMALFMSRQQAVNQLKAKMATAQGEQGETSQSASSEESPLSRLLKMVQDQGSRISTLESTIHQLLTRLSNTPQLSLIQTPNPIFTQPDISRPNPPSQNP